MTRTMPLPMPRRNLALAPMKPVARPNVVTTATFQWDPMTRTYHPESELLDRIRVWVNEGGSGGDIQ